MQRLKPKFCKICGTEFTPWSSVAKVCSPKCAIQYAAARRAEKAEKEERREQRKRKQALKTRSDWLREAQASFNAYVRCRDALDPCISSGRHHKGQYHAGHYRSVGACPELRFHWANCHKQSSCDNNHKSGNIVEYRINLIKKVGVEMVEWLEGPHQAQKWSIEEIQEIRDYYRQAKRELERD